MRGETVADLVSAYFDSFTIIRGTGHWKGEQEPTIIVEILAPAHDHVVQLMARTLRRNLNQEAVIVTVQPVTFTLEKGP